MRRYHGSHTSHPSPPFAFPSGLGNDDVYLDNLKWCLCLQMDTLAGGSGGGGGFLQAVEELGLRKGGYHTVGRPPPGLTGLGSLQ